MSEEKNSCKEYNKLIEEEKKDMGSLVTWWKVKKHLHNCDICPAWYKAQYEKIMKDKKMV